MAPFFGNKTAEYVFHQVLSKEFKRFPRELHRIAQRKIHWLKSASALSDLRQPPSNRLEKLKGDYAGFYSIRINDQWRLVFQWVDGHAEDIQIVDYH